MFVIFRDLFIGSIVLLWVGGAAHAAVDTRRRFSNRSARVFWPAVAGLVPIAGAGVYMLMRPSTTPDERRMRRLRLRYLESLAGPDDRLPQRNAAETAGATEQRARELVPAPVAIPA